MVLEVQSTSNDFNGCPDQGAEPEIPCDIKGTYDPIDLGFENSNFFLKKVRFVAIVYVEFYTCFEVVHIEKRQAYCLIQPQKLYNQKVK